MFINPFDVGDASAAGRSRARRPATSSASVRERAAIVALGPVGQGRRATISSRWRSTRRATTRTRARACCASLEEAPNYEKAQTLLLTLYDARYGKQRRRRSHEIRQDRRRSRASLIVLASRRRVGAARGRGGGGGFSSTSAARTRCISRRSFTATRRTTAASRSRASSTAAIEHVGREGPGWSHDYPDAEENFTKILRDITGDAPVRRAGADRRQRARRARRSARCSSIR